MRILPDKYITSEFWTARQRQAARIHEISYRACFKPQLPRYFIQRLTQPGEIVYDPFMGRGTTPIEASLMGRIPYGNDISPLARILTEPRINPPSIKSICERLESIDWWRPECSPNPDNPMLAFYHPETLHQIDSLRAHFRKWRLDKTDSWIRMVAVSRLSGHSPGFFSVRTLPPNQAVSVKRQRLLNKRNNLYPERKALAHLIIKKTKSLLSQKVPFTKKYLLLNETSEHTPEIYDRTVSLTVTSPPFLDVVDYKKDNWLRNWFLELDSPNVSVHKDISKWSEFTRRTLRELCRITKRGGYIAYEVGEVRKRQLLLEEIVAEAAKGLPLSLRNVYVNEQYFTKTANCWGVGNNRQGTNTNRILLFKREDQDELTSERENQLEQLLARFLEPLGNIPFEIFIRAWFKQKVIKFDPVSDSALFEIIKILGKNTCHLTIESKIISKRPNEVGNVLENYVKQAGEILGLDIEKPKGSGYPDLRLKYRDTVTYIEVKSYNLKSVDSSFRSFYLSPPKRPKIDSSGHHIVIGFEVEEVDNGNYCAKAFHLVDAYGLCCSLKFEAQSNNVLLYSNEQIVYSWDRQRNED